MSAKRTGKRTAKTTTSPKSHKEQRIVAGGVGSYYLAIVAVTILVGISAIMVISASSGEAVLLQGAEASLLASFGSGISNLLFIVLGAVAAFVISRFNYRTFAHLSFPLALVVIVGLLVTLAFGTDALGARRWIQIGGLSLQVSELAKPVLLLFAAYALIFIAEYTARRRCSRWRIIGLWSVPLAVIAPSVILILLQPDLGTTLILGSGLLIAYLLSGHSPKILFVALPVITAAFAVRAVLSASYQVQRVNSLIDGLFRGNYSHQVTQGLYALGSGGLFGLGPGLSRQKYFYLPQAQNDFILAIIGEEMGLFGTLLVVGAFALLMWTGLTIALGATDRMGRIIAAGATTMLLVQASLNLLAVVGLTPVTGKPLPFVTLGGSAMLASFVSLGLILSVARFGGDRKAAGANTQLIDESSLFRSAAEYMADLFERFGDGGLGGGGSRGDGGRSRGGRDDDGTRVKRSRTGGGEGDEGDLEWRWNCRAHLSGARARV
ncbi:MAG: FtsW/RodA/SpoVE family cell cycle protein [Coriobacteriia bacterium]|nr:FtsW/RodA/SpoVE family cell cycle protein [Coriobacteriia bacterium]